MAKYLFVPEPKKVQFFNGFLRIKIEDVALIEAYKAGEVGPPCIKISLSPQGRGKVLDEGYTLRVNSEGITIRAGTEAGVFYAYQTLKQLLFQEEELQIQYCFIEDYPDFKARGVLLDVSRDRVPVMASLKELVNKLASWKYNQLQLYIEHTFAYTGHEQVWKQASPFTAEEIRELDAYCSQRYVELVPNQNSFGHMERWLRHKDYHHLAESPQGFTDAHGVWWDYSSTLAPEVPAVPDFLASLYDELLPCFKSDMLNAGGDEPWELGKGRSKESCEQRGLDRVYLDFLLKIQDLGAARGKRVQIYGDIIMKYPHLIKELPKDMILVNWGYEADHSFEGECEKIGASGLPFYICAGTSSWNSIGGRWENARGNIKNAAENGLNFGAEGFLVSEWGDNGHWQQITAGLPGLLFGACASWNTGKLDRFSLVPYTAVHLFAGNTGLAQASARIQSVWKCSGKNLHNASLPALLLLDPLYPYYREQFRNFRFYDFSREFAMLDEADSFLSEAGDSQYKDELAFSSVLLRHGCKLGQFQLATQKLSIDSIPAEGRRVLAEELAPLMEEYQRLWLRTSRKGGLFDSLRRFQALMKLYTQ